MSEAAIAIATGFIADREGFRANPYQDAGRGVWTIAYGFTYMADGSPVGPHTPPVTQEAAYARLQGMVAGVVASVQQMVAVPVTDNQLAALASFAFNEGTHALRVSKLLLLLNQGHPEQAAEQFAVWVYANGKVNQGLVNRRRMEAELFLRPDDPAPPAPDPDPFADALMAAEEISEKPQNTARLSHDSTVEEISPVAPDPDHSADILNAAELNPAPDGPATQEQP